MADWTMVCQGGPYDGEEFTIADPELNLSRLVWGPEGATLYTEASRGVLTITVEPA